MPMIDAPAEIYRTSTILGERENLPRASVFLRDKLFSGGGHRSNRPGGHQFLQGQSQARPLLQPIRRWDRGSTRASTIAVVSPPFMKPVRTLTADDVFYRSMSVPGANNDSRDAQLLALDITELDNEFKKGRVDGESNAF